ncbi:MAG: (2,3-dihydroxybenzoyl)adenylate synthase [Mycobacteriales bacterium]
MTARTGTVPWPDDFAARYREAGYWRGRPLGNWMWDWADRWGDRTAVVDGERRLSYRELAERADALADRLAGLGLRDGDNMLVQLPNCAEFLILFLACQRIGVAPLLALLPHREHELSFLADLARVAAIAVPDTHSGYDHQDLAAKLAAGVGRPCQVLVLGADVRDGHADLRALTEPGPDPAATRRRLDRVAPDPGSVALFLLSGGTTGLPKIIARTHDDYEYNARACAAACGFGADTVYLVILPIAHNFPLGSPGALGALRAGGRVVMARSPNPEVAFPLVERERVTATSFVPAVGQRWSEEAAGSGYDLSSLRVVQLGGSVPPPGLPGRIAAALGCAVQQVYGMAEGLINYTRPDDPPDIAWHTQGRPVSPGDEVRLVDEHDCDVPAGEVGQLLTRGPYTPRGYFAAPEHNARAFTADGWYRSGDLVRWDTSGNLVVEGRVKDLINRGGEKISAPEIEALVESLPQVRQAAAVPVGDPELGERIGLCVVLRPGTALTLAEVRAAVVASGAARFKAPERLAVLDTLPLTAVGKVDKKALRRYIESQEGVDVHG